MIDEKRKMLECAAKAAGKSIRYIDDDGDAHIKDEPHTVWNPANYNEDAFRLMSSLNIQVTPYSHRTTCSAVGISAVSIFHEKGSDVSAGRRLAITLAAARLGGYDG